MDQSPHHFQTLAARVARYELWPIGFVTALGIASERFLPFAVSIAAAFWLIRWYAFGRPSVPTPIDLPVLILIGMLVVTCRVTALPDITIPQVLRVLLGISLCYTIVNWTTTTTRLYFLVSLFTTIALLFVLMSGFLVDWSYWEKFTLFFIPISIYDYFPLIVSNSVNPNVMAGTLLLLLPFGLAPVLFGWSTSSWLARIRDMLLLLAAAVMILLTQSRGGILALVVTTTAAFLMRWPRMTLICVAIILMSITTAQLNAQAPLTQRFMKMTPSFIEDRLEIWPRSVEMIQDFPITGIGMGSFLPMANKRYPFDSEALAFEARHSHNLFLQVAVDLGLPGLVAWLGILFFVLIIAVRLFQYGYQNDHPELVTLGATLFVSQIALMSYGMIDSVTWGMVRSAPIVWAIWGMALAGARLYFPPNRQLAAVPLLRL